MRARRLRQLLAAICCANLFCAAVAPAQTAVSKSESPTAESREVAYALFIDDGRVENRATPAAWASFAGDQEFQSPLAPGYSATPCAGCFSNHALPVCDDCPRWGLVIFEGYDAFQGVSDGGWENNGLHAGVNFGTRLGPLSDLAGIGFQIGGSAAAYDWSGADYRLTHANQAEPQGFVTYGLFRKSNEDSRWTTAVVQDWMINANYGVFGENPTLSQVRVQLGFAVNAWNEAGVWSAWRVLENTRNVPTVGPTTWRPLNQVNGYWHHKWNEGGADTWLWIGAPERERFFGDGSLGDWIAGALANVPLSDRVGLYATVSYMHPSARPGDPGATEEAWNFTIGVSFYPQSNARSETVAGQCWMPQLPVANNGTFLVDGNRQF